MLARAGTKVGHRHGVCGTSAFRSGSLARRSLESEPSILRFRWAPLPPGTRTALVRLNLHCFRSSMVRMLCSIFGQTVQGGIATKRPLDAVGFGTLLSLQTFAASRHSLLA